jgi:1,4-dihydroxy-2-naphthoyl-CoA hydrolase
MALLDVEFDECTRTRVSGSIAADERHHQPWGIVHGGLYTTAIETFATTGAYEAVKDRGQQAVRSRKRHRPPASPPNRPPQAQ